MCKHLTCSSLDGDFFLKRMSHNLSVLYFIKKGQAQAQSIKQYKNDNIVDIAYIEKSTKRFLFVIHDNGVIDGFFTQSNSSSFVPFSPICPKKCIKIDDFTYFPGKDKETTEFWRKCELYILYKGEIYVMDPFQREKKWEKLHCNLYRGKKLTWEKIYCTDDLRSFYAKEKDKNDYYYIRFKAQVDRWEDWCVLEIFWKYKLKKVISRSPNFYCLRSSWDAYWLCNSYAKSGECKIKDGCITKDYFIGIEECYTLGGRRYYDIVPMKHYPLKRDLALKAKIAAALTPIKAIMQKPIILLGGNKAFYILTDNTKLEKKKTNKSKSLLGPLLGRKELYRVSINENDVKLDKILDIFDSTAANNHRHREEEEEEEGESLNFISPPPENVALKQRFRKETFPRNKVVWNKSYKFVLAMGRVYFTHLSSKTPSRDWLLLSDLDNIYNIICIDCPKMFGGVGLFYTKFVNTHLGRLEDYRDKNFDAVAFFIQVGGQVHVRGLKEGNVCNETMFSFRGIRQIRITPDNEIPKGMDRLRRYNTGLIQNDYMYIRKKNRRQCFVYAIDNLIYIKLIEFKKNNFHLPTLSRVGCPEEIKLLEVDCYRAWLVTINNHIHNIILYDCCDKIYHDIKLSPPIVKFQQSNIKKLIPTNSRKCFFITEDGNLFELCDEKQDKGATHIHNIPGRIITGAYCRQTNNIIFTLIDKDICIYNPISNSYLLRKNFFDNEDTVTEICCYDSCCSFLTAFGGVYSFEIIDEKDRKKINFSSPDIYVSSKM